MDYELLAAYLAGDCTEAEKKAVESWRNASARNEREFGRYQLLWEASRAEPEQYEPDMARAWARIQPQPELRPVYRQPGLYGWASRIAAALLVGLLLGAGWYTYRIAHKPGVTWVERNTPAGQQRRLQLADGSVVWLNANSRLRYPEEFTGQRREVHLEGEAFFEVAKDPGKPFLIRTHQTTTRVLGTSFVVRGYAGEEAVAVVVVTGKVAFSAENKLQAVTLTSGEQGVLHKKANRIRKSVNRDPNFLAWKTRTLSFANTPLRQVLPALEDYFGVTFSAADEALLDCRFTGIFKEPKLEEVLKVFAYGRDITYRQSGSVYRLSGKGCRDSPKARRQRVLPPNENPNGDETHP